MGTIVHVDGFDDYDPTTQATLYGWDRNFASTGSGRVAGRYAGALNQSYVLSLPSNAQYTVGFAFQLSDPTDSQNSVVRFREGTTAHVGISYNGAGVFSVFRGTSATILASSAVQTINTNTWYHLQFDAKIGDSDGEYELKLNDVSIITRGTGADTRNTGTGIIDNVIWTPNTTIRLDDLVLTQGGGFQGDCRVVTQMPDADGANTAWAVAGSPEYVASGTYTIGTGLITVPWPSGHLVGDIGLLVLESAGGEAISLNAANGFVEVTNSPQATGSGTAGTRLAMYWCRATSQTMPSPVVNDPGDHINGCILTFRGCIGSGDPFDITGGGVKGTGSTSFSATGVTTTVDRCLIVVAGTHDVDTANPNFDTWANSNLVSITERVDAGSASGNGGGHGVATGVLTSAGASGTTTATHSVSAINAFLTVALKPASSDFDTVDDYLPDSDTSYLTTSSAGDRETFGFPDLGVTGTVKAVAVVHVSRKDDAGDRKVVTVVRRGSTNYDNATTQTLSTDYAAQQQVYELDPSTSAAWSVSNVNAGEFGIKLDT